MSNPLDNLRIAVERHERGECPTHGRGCEDAGCERRESAELSRQDELEHELRAAEDIAQHLADCAQSAKDELERANQRIIGAERLLLRASRIIELEDWRDDYDAWMSSAACPHCIDRLSGHDPECPTLRAKRSPALRPEFIALAEALGLSKPGADK
jgi:hypothetical protein